MDRSDLEFVWAMVRLVPFALVLCFAAAGFLTIVKFVMLLAIQAVS